VLKGFILGIVMVLVIGAAIAFAVVSSGLIPAAADGKALPLEEWAARTSLRATLNKNAPKGPNPVALTDENLIAGIGLYGEHCAICHGTAKGDASSSPVAKGEYPAPPQLASDGVEDDPEGWTYWKLENGIRWSGMPAWKGTLSSQKMWTLSLLLAHMDKLPPAAQQAWEGLGSKAQPN